MANARNPAPEYHLLDEAAVATALESLEGFEIAREGKAIVRSFRFKTFVEAFSFMTEVALLAEKMNHHPEWSNVYGRVDVTLTTHVAGGISDLDIHMAGVMNRAAERRSLRKN